jgi:hypothetical protein
VEKIAAECDFGIIEYAICLILPGGLSCGSYALGRFCGQDMSARTT